MLSALISSIITLAGTVFSVMIVVLTLASQQFGPRLLRAFMNDVRNQIVLGAFMSSFLYNLLVMGQVQEAQSQNAFVPRLAVTAGLAIAIASFVLLIFFIHHMAASVRAENIIRRVAQELDEQINLMYPEQLGHPHPHAEQAPLPADFERRLLCIPSPGTGYIETIDTQDLLHLACRDDLLLRLDCKPGDFILSGSTLACVYPADRLDDKTVRRLAFAFSLSAQRTPTQDVEFGIMQLVEMACHALSPSLNDPHTALICADQLGAALCTLVRREVPSSYRSDDRGRLRIIAPVASLNELMDAAFMQFRQCAAKELLVCDRLLQTMGTIRRHAQRDDDRRTILQHAELVRDIALHYLFDPREIAHIQQRFQQAAADAGGPMAGPTG